MRRSVIIFTIGSNKNESVTKHGSQKESFHKNDSAINLGVYELPLK